MSRSSTWARLPTERIHPSTWDLDCKTPDAVLRLMATEDRRVIREVYRESSRIEKAAEKVADSLAAGGRVLFVGAGTGAFT